jgi:hypothetical protein
MSVEQRRQEFPEAVQFRGPRGTRAAIWKLARAKRKSPSELLRDFSYRALEEAGIQIEAAGEIAE